MLGGDLHTSTHPTLDQLGKGGAIIRVIIVLRGRGRGHKTTVTEIGLDGGWDDLAPGSLDSIYGIKNCPVESLPASMAFSKVAVVVGLEGGNDALVYGMGDGGGVGWQEDELDGLNSAVDVGMGSAVVQDEGHLALLSGEDPVLLVKPVAEEVASHPGLLVGMKLH